MFTWRIGSPLEIHAIPKLLMDPLARVIINADQAAPFPFEVLCNRADFILGWLNGGWIVQIHSCPVIGHVIDDHGIFKPEWIPFQSDVIAIIDIARDAMRSDADIFQGGDGLGSP